MSFVVTTLADGAGAGTLRWAVSQADSAGGNQTITFASSLTQNGPATIDLTDAGLRVDDPSGTLTIQGPTTGSLSINAQNDSRDFVVSSDCVISNLTITGGKTAGVGGAIYNLAALTIENCTVVADHATGNGGGIDNAGTLTILNSTLYGNSSAGSGGGIYSSGTLSITDTTISGNSAQSDGGGIQNASTTAAQLNGTIIALDTGGDLSGSFAGSYDIVADGSGQFDSNTSSYIYVANPQLTPLAFNGGPTETMALQTDSPAIGHGSAFDGITTDQRGDPRPSDDPDIGSYQTQQPLTVVGQTLTATSGQSFTGNVAFAIFPSAVDGGTEPNELTALIDWGDGSVSGAMVTGGYQDFDVTGTHQYSSPGTYYPLVTVTAQSPNDAGYFTAQATATIKVGLPLVTSFKVNNGNPQRTTVTSLTLNLSQALALTTSSFTLMETAATNSVSPQQESFLLSASNGDQTYTLTFPQSIFSQDAGNSLPNGTYTLTLLGFGAAAGTQSNPQFSFYCQSGGATDSPTVSIQPIPAASAGTAITVNVSAAPFGNNGDLLSYQWFVTNEDGDSLALQNGGVTSVPSVTFTPNAAGNWSVGVTVTDTDLSTFTSASPQSFSVAAAGNSLLSADFGSDGLTNLSYNGWTFANDGGVGDPAMSLSALVVNPAGTPVSESISSQWNSASDTMTYTAQDFTVTVQYVLQQTQLDYNINVLNTSTEGNTLEGIQLCLLRQMSMPVSMATNTALGIQSPLFVTDDTGGAAGVVALAVQQQVPGYVQLDSISGTIVSADFCTYPTWNNPTSWPSMISPISPGDSATYNASLRFGPTGTGPQMVQDINEAFSTQYPSTLQWNNRQSVAILFPTSVSGLNTDTTSPNEALSFAQGLLEYAAYSIAQMQADGEQGMVSWNIEGVPSVGAYVGDPTLATTLDPNLAQPIPPESDFSQAVADYYVPLPATDDLADEYFAMFTHAGLEVGVTIRADQAEIGDLGSTPAQNVVWQQFAADPAQQLISKIEYAEENWGCTLFYIDSIPAYYSGVLAEVHAALPNVLLIPEHMSTATYASAAPFNQAPSAATDPPPIPLDSLTTPSTVTAVYPNAFGITRDGNADGTAVVPQDLPAISQAILDGNTFFIDLNVGENSPIATALSTLAFDDAIYTSQNTTQALSNDTITLRADGPDAYEILRNGLVIYSGQISGSPQLAFDFGGSNETLVIDTSDGNPIPAAGISFDAAANSNDTLVVIGASGTNTIAFTGHTVTIGSSTITFQNVANLQFDPRGGVDNLSIDAATVLLPAQSPGQGILADNFSTLSIGSGATLNVATAAARSDMTRITTSSLVVEGTLNLGGNEMIIDYNNGSDPISTIRSLLTAGYNGGAWNGPGIDSSAAAANHDYALGYADGADGVVAGLASGQIEILYTLYGDANLDGVVNGQDMAIVDSNRNTQPASWDQGDFNYSGMTSILDIELTEQNWGDSA